MRRSHHNPLADDLNPKTYEDFARAADKILQSYARIRQKERALTDVVIGKVSMGASAARKYMGLVRTLQWSGVDRIQAIEDAWREFLKQRQFVGAPPPLTALDLNRIERLVAAEDALQDQMQDVENILHVLVDKAESNGVDVHGTLVRFYGPGRWLGVPSVDGINHVKTRNEFQPVEFYSPAIKKNPKKKNPLDDDLNPKTYEDFARVADRILEAYARFAFQRAVIEDLVLPNGEVVASANAVWRAQQTDKPYRAVVENYAAKIKFVEQRENGAEKLLRGVIARAEANNVPLGHLPRTGPGPTDADRILLAAVFEVNDDEAVHVRRYFASRTPPKKKNPLVDDLNPKTGRQLAELGLKLYKASDKWRAQYFDMKLVLRPSAQFPNDSFVLHGTNILDYVDGFVSVLSSNQQAALHRNDVTKDEKARIDNAYKRARYMLDQAEKLDKMFEIAARAAQQNGVQADFGRLLDAANDEGAPLFERLLSGKTRKRDPHLVL